MPDNVFSIAVALLIIGHDADGEDHNRTLTLEMQISNQDNLKLNSNKCHF